MSENCKSLVLQDKCIIEIFLSPGGDSVVVHSLFVVAPILCRDFVFDPFCGLVLAVLSRKV